MTQLPLSLGNHKLPKTTAIFNIGPAMTCAARVLGLCQLDTLGIGSHKCYALKAERMRPRVLAYRIRQTDVWDSGILLTELAGWLDKHSRVDTIRLNESGDFRHQQDVDTLGQLALHVEACSKDWRIPRSIQWYCYTARNDLDYSRLPELVTVNGSGFMVHNEYRVIVPGKPATEDPEIVCPGSCKLCRLCITRHNRTIGARVH